MENKNTKKSLTWLIIVVAVVAVAAVVVGVLYFKPDSESQPKNTFGCEETAEKFIEAYITYDRLSQFDLYLYDAHTRWKDQQIKSEGSEETFCANAQKSADEQGINVTISSFEDYLTAYHRQDQIYKQEAYGDYAISTTSETRLMNADEASNYIATALDAIGEDYLPKGADTIKEVYVVKVNVTIDGTKKDYSEHFQVYMVQFKGEWLVLSHST